MSQETKIRWTDFTWNPIRGCAIVSPGCSRCYAMRTASRFSGPGQPFEGFAEVVNGHPVWTGKVATLPNKLREPLTWQRKAEKTGEHIRVFVNSMSDVFHPDVPFAFIDEMFAVMAWCPAVTFQILTKRPERMREYLIDRGRTNAIEGAMCELCMKRDGRLCGFGNDDCQLECLEFPPPNVWLGASVEDQRRADERIPVLLDTPAAVRFLSCEPLIAPVSLRPWLFESESSTFPDQSGMTWWKPTTRLHQVIVGGESGPGFRPMDVRWARLLRDQCHQAGIAFFYKQGSAPRTEMDPVLDGFRWEQYPGELTPPIAVKETV